MTLDLDQLERLIKTSKQPAQPVSGATALALIAEVRALQEDKARLDSGCIVTYERDEFGEEYRCERRGNDLRAMIDAARREKA